MKYNKNNKKFNTDFEKNIDYVAIEYKESSCEVSKTLSDNHNIKVFMIEDKYLIKQSDNSPLLEMSYYSNSKDKKSSFNGKKYEKRTSYCNKTSKEFDDNDWNFLNVRNTFDEYFDENQIISTKNPSISEDKANRKIVNIEDNEDYNDFI